MSTASHFNINEHIQKQTLPERMFATTGASQARSPITMGATQRFAAVMFVLAFLAFGVYFLHPFSIESSYATSSDATVNVADSLSISATPVSITDTPESSGSWLTGTSNVVVSTNNATGYKLYISSSDSQVDLVNNSNSSYKIASLSAETPESTFKSDNSLMNHYGFTHDNNGNNTDLGQITSGTYLPITDVNNARLINATEEKQNLSTTNVTFATKIDRSIPAGEYTNTITFTAIANPVLHPIKDNMYMQDVTQQICADTEEYATSGTTYTLKDKRTEESYKVRKLADGRCWMVENLYLNGGTTLTSEYSDIDDTTTLTQPNGSTATGSYTLPASSTSGFSTSSVTNMYAGSKSTGSYFTWNVATAGEGAAYGQGSAQTTTNSICPKNWKLPYSDGSSSTTNEFYALYSKYNSASAFSTPFNFTAVGRYDNGSLGDTTGTYWWSSRSGHTSNAYYMYMNSSNVYPADNYYKYYGRSVRCVLPAS